MGHPCHGVGRAWGASADVECNRKVGHVLFNPAADNILASSSGDYTVKLWDLADGQAKLTLKHNDIVQSLSWSANGSMLVTTSRDKKLRFWDVRQQKPAHEVPGHTGAKNSRVAWMGEHDRVVTTGFSKMSDRQLGLWDLRNPAKPVGGDFIFLDSISGVCMPFWDDSCQMLYLAGKGDGNIRYYEYEHDKFEPLSEHKSPEPQRGIAFLPKRGVNTHANEVMRAYKTVNDAYIEPIAFIVPRRSEMFQDDIYPPATAATPAVSSADWLAGKTALPPKLSMEDLFDGQEPKEIPAEDIPRPSTTRSAPEPAPASAPAPKADEPKPEPTPTPAPAATAVAAREMPTVNSNKQSMASIASKFGDADADDDEDDASSFEEIPKPIERPSVAAAAAARQEKSEPAASTTRSAPAPQPATQPSAESSSAQSPPAPASVTSRPAAEVNGRAEPSGGSNAPAAPAATAGSGVPARAGSAATAAGGLKEVLGEIKGLLEAQSRQIESLRQEVGELRAVVKGE